MIGFAAERLMQLETEGIFNEARSERNADRFNQQNGYQDTTSGGTIRRTDKRKRYPSSKSSIWP